MCVGVGDLEDPSVMNLLVCEFTKLKSCRGRVNLTTEGRSKYRNVKDYEIFTRNKTSRLIEGRIIVGYEFN